MSGRDLRSFVTSHRVANAGISGWSRIVLICHYLNLHCSKQALLCNVLSVDISSTVAAVLVTINIFLIN